MFEKIYEIPGLLDNPLRTAIVNMRWIFYILGIRQRKVGGGRELQSYNDAILWYLQSNSNQNGIRSFILLNFQKNEENHWLLNWWRILGKANP